MSRKNTNIIVILAIVAVIIFVVLGLMGFGGFSPVPQEGETTGAQAILNEIKNTGTVAALRVQEISEGQGDAVVAGDKVTVNYIGVLPDGTVFDSSEIHGEPFTFTVGEGKVIPGWEQGLLGMKEGGRRLLAVPPAFGYGAQAIGQIPANATLIFDIQLVKRVSAGTPAVSVPKAN